MKKILLSLMALLLMGSMSVWAALPPKIEGNVFTDDGKNIKITKVSDGEYLVEAIDGNSAVNFDKLPEGPAEAAFVDAFNAGTSITLKGNFSSIDAMKSTSLNWTEVNIQDLDGSNTNPGISDYFGSNVETLLLSDYATSLPNSINSFSNLKNLTFGASVETIPSQYMIRNTYINTISFHTKTINGVLKGAKKIENQAFKACTNLTTVNFPSTMEEIGTMLYANKGEGAFAESGLTALDLSGTSVKSLGMAAFEKTKLTSVQMPSSLEYIGAEAFTDVETLGSIDLSMCTELHTIDYEAFEDCKILESITFPSGSTLTTIANDCFNRAGLKEVDMSMCEGITEFGHYKTQWSENVDQIKTFMDCKQLTKITLPPNLSKMPKDTGQGPLHGCENLVEVIFTGNADATNSKPLVIEDNALFKLSKLQKVTFSNRTTSIGYEAFSECDVLDLDLSNCHFLTYIGQHAFEKNTNLASVKVCSHPKVIKGTEGSGAFNNCKKIKTVEVVGCPGTNLVECRCENNAFDPDITYVQTSIDNIEPNGCLLIFPEGGEFESKMAGNTYGYASAFDYFVGNYKEGIPFTQNQSALEKFFKFAPRGEKSNCVNYPHSGDETEAYCASDAAMVAKYGSNCGNGWHEFMKVSTGIIINNEDEHFLRTYSRTRGSGPVLLKTDLGITAYRAVDYISTKSEYVANKRGDYVFVPGDKNKLHEGEDEYLTKKQCEDAGINIKGLKTYSYATVAGTLYLRPLHPKYKNSTAVNEDYSYIPELTGVVLYSKKTAEDVFLIFASYAGTEYDLSIQYPHTGKVRRESTRLETEADNINMLQGSYGEDTGVAPVDPWTYADPENFKGGTYNPAKIDYRQFAYSISQEKWIRLQPGRMKYNRAFAKIPAAYFNNHNETTDQMPDFTLSDVPEPTTPEEDTDETEGGVGANTLLLIDYSFDDVAAETDGIKTINETQVVDDNAWYTLQGVKVTQPVKGGVYIHNNKKVVIK